MWFYSWTASPAFYSFALLCTKCALVVDSLARVSRKAIGCVCVRQYFTSTRYRVGISKFGAAVSSNSRSRNTIIRRGRGSDALMSQDTGITVDNLSPLQDTRLRVTDYKVSRSRNTTSGDRGIPCSAVMGARSQTSIRPRSRCLVCTSRSW